MVKELVLDVLRRGGGSAWQEAVYREVVDAPTDHQWWIDLPGHRRVNLIRATIEDLVTDYMIEEDPSTRQATGRAKLRLVNVLDQIERRLR